MIEYIYLILGFLGLILGAEILIRGSVNLANIFKVSPFIIGVVIVAGGTSLPELAASLQSINLGFEGIVIGNVIGSNIANILLIIGVVDRSAPTKLITSPFSQSPAEPPAASRPKKPPDCPDRHE